MSRRPDWASVLAVVIVVVIALAILSTAWH